MSKDAWSCLRDGRLDNVSFRRQHPVGVSVLDFYRPQLRPAIELDGGQHNSGANEGRDRRRDAWLEGCGVTVLRSWNNGVTENLTGVLEKIKAVADELTATGKTPTRRWRADLPLSGGG